MMVFNIFYLFFGYCYQCYLGVCIVYVDFMFVEIDEFRRMIEGVQMMFEDLYVDEIKVLEYICF